MLSMALVIALDGINHRTVSMALIIAACTAHLHATMSRLWVARGWTVCAIVLLFGSLLCLLPPTPITFLLVLLVTPPFRHHPCAWQAWIGHHPCMVGMD